MKIPFVFAIGVAFIPITVFADDSLYCPQHQRYINPGMSAAEVINACGPPTSINKATGEVTQKVPVTQLIYTTLNQGAVYPGLTVYYKMWSLPSGSQGTSLHVNVVEDKVTGITINGSSSNAMSICGDNSVQIGDDVNEVYSACGSPSLVNQTYINQPIPRSGHPEVWIYQSDPNQPAFNLTFVNGNLQSIQQ